MQTLEWLMQPIRTNCMYHESKTLGSMSTGAIEQSSCLPPFVGIYSLLKHCSSKSVQADPYVGLPKCYKTRYPLLHQSVEGASQSSNCLALELT